MAFPSPKNQNILFHYSIVFILLFIVASPGAMSAQTSTSLPQKFARSIFCTVNNFLGIKSCEPLKGAPKADPVASRSFIPVDAEPPQIIQNITQPVIERTLHTREIINQILPDQKNETVEQAENFLAQFSRQLEQLSQNLYTAPSHIYDDTALWRAISLMNAGSASASSRSSDQSLAFNAGSSILTISSGNSVDLSALSGGGGGAGSDDQTLTAATYNTSSKELSISIENGNTVTIDLSDLIDDADASATNEIQGLSLAGDSLSISATSTAIDLSPYLDDTTLSELEVDAFVGDNGYLTSEVDGSITNEIQDLQLSGNSLTITDNGTATTIDLSPYLDNTDTLSGLACSSNEIAKWNGSAWGCSADASGTGGTDDQTIDSFSLSANIISLSLEGDGEAAKTIDLTAYVNTDTQLNESQVDNFVANNGYLTVETDDQTIDTFGLVGDTLSLSLESDGEAAKTVDLSSYAKDSDLHAAITLSGAFDYFTLVGQNIVRGAIDLATDITGTLSIGNGGTGATTTALARSNLGLAIGANVQAFDSDTSLIGQTIETSEITNGTILGADLNLTDITLADFTNDQSFITDGNSNWDNSYGFITDANDTVSGSELDGVFSTTGFLIRTGVGTYGILNDNSTNWNTAFGWGDHATEGYLTGITGQSIKTLSDVYSSMTPIDGQVLTFDTTNGWQAEDAGSGSLFTDGGTSTYLSSLTDNLGIGTTTPTSLLQLVSAADAAIGFQTNISVSSSGTQTFNYTGSEQTWVVPAGVTSITVDARGARGGGDGGNGGRIEVTATTTPGETLYIYVGSTAGYNGGGSGGSGYFSASSGGGASDIRQISNALGDRIVVAGGGGAKGAANSFIGSLGGSGGAGGGFGGGGNGGEAPLFTASGDPGGTGSSGSGAGAGSGTSGSIGAGGGGAVASGSQNQGAGGGGGGGGYNGGGGGAGGDWASGGGGGGGSSYPSTGTHTVGYQNGDGQVIISYSSSSTQDVDWVLGTDRSQEGFFKLAASTALGTSDLLTINPSGNVGIGNSNPVYPLHMGSGAYVSAGGSWTNASSRDLKENFISLNPTDILTSINALDISQWNYKAEDASVLHIGPIAQDFFAEFGLGGSDVSISTIDTAGVALIGIQALSHKYEDMFAGLSITKDGTLIVLNLEADNLKTNNFCLGSTCIDEAEFRDLLDLEPRDEASTIANEPAKSPDPINDTPADNQEEPLEVTAPSTTPLQDASDQIEQATSTDEQVTVLPHLSGEDQTLEDEANEIPVEADTVIVEEPQSEEQTEDTEIVQITEPEPAPKPTPEAESDPEPIDQAPVIENSPELNPSAEDTEAAPDN